MGQVIKKLAERELESKAIFDKRFVVELCENVHIHYRNLRIITSLNDFLSLGKGMADAVKRYEALGCPQPSREKHTELCRKAVASEPQGDGIKVTLNRNLYPLHENRIFSEGAEFDEPIYVHLKIRDLRLELSLDEFHALQKAMAEAVVVNNRHMLVKDVVR